MGRPSWPAGRTPHATREWPEMDGSEVIVIDDSDDDRAAPAAASSKKRKAEPTARGGSGAAAAAPPPSPRAAIAEKRCRRFLSSPSTDTRARIARAKSQRMFLIAQQDRTSDERGISRAFTVRSSLARVASNGRSTHTPGFPNVVGCTMRSNSAS